MKSVFQLLFLVFAACVLASVVFSATTCPPGKEVTNLAAIRAKIDEWNKTITELAGDSALAQWKWDSNITDDNEKIKSSAAAKFAEKNKQIWQEAACLNCKAAGCSDLESRIIKKLATIGTDALPSNLFDELTVVLATMQDIYATAKACPPDGSPCMNLDPGLTNLLAESNSFCKLQWGWEVWRNITGRRMRGHFMAYSILQNKAAEINGFPNAKEMWTSSYADDDGGSFIDQLEQAWKDVKPLYQQLHTYVRRKLIAKYTKFSAQFPKSGHIPAHLLGNMWSQEWTTLYPIVVPYPDASPVDLTALLKQNKYTVMSMVRESDKFFQSIGLAPMSDEFWKNSIFERRNDTEMVCHASAWDFYKQNDFRIKMCTQVTREDFSTIHHEMGHIQYFMQYKDQPVIFRDGANPGFHEAIGDLIALSVMTPRHLKAINLLPESFVEDEQTNLNVLMSMALEKISFLPFGFLVDKYRWAVFDGNTTFSALNEDWWRLRCGLQGVSPPVNRSEDDFDPGAKYHVAASVPYDRYFFSFIAQFQFHRAICRQMGLTKDFHKCDIYNNTEATKSLRQALSMGSSKPYPEVLKLLTNSTRLDSSAILDYFAPLYNWLKEQNKDDKVGWDENSCPKPIPSSPCNYNQLNFLSSGDTSGAMSRIGSSPKWLIVTFMLPLQALFSRIMNDIK